MVNAYGPTEATVCATMSAPLAGAEAPALGRPIANMRVYILDDRLEPVPVGVAGELYLGGVGLARGYVGRPGLTAERFVADPFGAAGGRLYRTGDLGRWRGDGVVEFLGRSDGQVKLRGLRIEPGEIEAALLEHGAVAQAAVVVWRERLVAYVVAREAPVAAAALRFHLAARLPAHMLPQGYVWLDALPRTPSGKLDRRALPEPVWREAEGYQAPQGAVEELLAALWAELLGIARVGRHDNFFDLGGHSLLATRLVSRVRGGLGVELALRSVFEHPSLMGLAGVVSGAAPAAGEALRAGAASGVAAAVVRAAAAVVPGAAGGRLELHRADGAAAGGAARRGGAAARRSRRWWRATRRCAPCFPVVDGVAVQSVEPAVAVCARRGGGSDGGAGRRGLRRCRGSASISRWSCRSRRACCGSAPSCMCWRWWCTTSRSTAGRRRSCCRSCRTLYGAALEGSEASLPALPVQYADYALWQRRHLADGARPRLLARRAGGGARGAVAADGPAARARGAAAARA